MISQVLILTFHVSLFNHFLAQLFTTRLSTVCQCNVTIFKVDTGWQWLSCASSWEREKQSCIASYPSSLARIGEDMTKNYSSQRRRNTFYTHTANSSGLKAEVKEWIIDLRNRICVRKSDISKKRCGMTDFAWTTWSFKFMKSHELCNTKQLWVFKEMWDH